MSKGGVALFNDNDRKTWPKGIFRSRFSIFGQPPSVRAQLIFLGSSQVELKMIVKLEPDMIIIPKYKSWIIHRYVTK